MSFDQISNLEAGVARGRYTDDPGFQNLLSDLHNKLLTLQRNTAQLRTDVGLLGTRRDTARVRERVHNLLERSRSMCQNIGDGVKQLQRWDDLTKQQKYEQNKVATQFQDALAEFQSLQRTALEKQRASVSAARAAHESDGAAYGPDGHLLSAQERQQQEQELEQQELIRLAPQSEVDFQEALIIEREEEIRNIEQGVGDLNVLFRQVAQIVSEQGETLNTIADNVETARDHTRNALVENTQAMRYQKATRNKSFCLLLILMIILTIVLLAIFA